MSHCRLHMRRYFLLLLVHKSCWLAKPFILLSALLNSSCFSVHSHLDPMLCLGLVMCSPPPSPPPSSTVQTRLWDGNRSESCFCVVQRHVSASLCWVSSPSWVWWDSETCKQQAFLPIGAQTRVLVQGSNSYFCCLSLEALKLGECGRLS